MNSTEELSDVYAHFTLYYGKDMVAMRNRQAGKGGLDDLNMDTSLDGSQVNLCLICSLASVDFVCWLVLKLLMQLFCIIVTMIF